MPIVKLPTELDLGRYRLSARLGQGGMAELFLGRLIGPGGFEKLVAIKRILPHLSSDSNFVAMFQNEGRIAAQLNHPNVCQVFELGEADGQLFLAMELLRGLPWAEVVPAIPDRPLATVVRFVVGVVVQACEGLHYAHRLMDVDGTPRPIVHRDVSPANLFVTSDGIVKLVDFGVSKIISDLTTTRAGVLKGKLAYMAPEQLRGEPVDARCDIFAIAALTWEALAAKPLFAEESAYDARHGIRRIPPLPGDGPLIERLDATLRRALAADRDQRPVSARAFAIELRRAIEACGDPMSPNDIQSHVQLWLAPSLARRSRDLAEIVGQLRAGHASEDADTREPETRRVGDQTETTMTTPEAPSAPIGVRLRDASVVIGATHDERDAAPTLETPPRKPSDS